MLSAPALRPAHRPKCPVPARTGQAQTVPARTGPGAEHGAGFASARLLAR